MFVCVRRSELWRRATRRSKLSRPKRLIYRPRSQIKRPSMMKITKVFVWDLYNDELDENMQQYQQIIELEFENENLKEQIAAMKAGNSEAGPGDELSEEEQADQQAEQFATA